MTTGSEQALHGRTAVVFHTGTAPGHELAQGLADVGATVVEPDVAVGSSPRPDLAVISALPGDGGRAREMVDLDAAGWVEVCERPLRQAKDDLVAARHLLADGGTVVAIAPVAAITGEAGLAGYSAVAEGVRAMALSCARAWGEHDITVHWVGVPTSLLAEGGSAVRLTLWDEALGRAPTLRHDVAQAIAGLAAPTMRFVTGTSITVDGGIVMHT